MIRKIEVSFTAVAVAVALTAGAAWVAAVPSPAHAQSNRELQSRMIGLEKRIDRAYEKGRLSRRDVAFLKGELAAIRDEEDRMRANGRFSLREREIIDARLNKLSTDINDEVVRR